MVLDIESLKQKIRHAVAGHYSQPKWEPLLLAKLGDQLAAHNTYTPDGRPGSMKRFIESELNAEIGVMQHPDIVSYVAVYPKDLHQQVASALQNVKPRRSRDSARFPRSLLIAFCRNVPDGKKIFFKRSYPYKYVVGDIVPTDDFVEIEHEYRLPGYEISETGDLSEDLRTKLFSRIQAWSERHNIDGEHQWLRPWPSREKNAEVATNALARLIESWPPELRRQIRIPADIIEILLRHP